jgi:hypothetical protein
MAATHFSGPVVSTAGFQSGSGSVEVVAAADTLVAADNGKTFILNAAAGVTITLPAVTTTGWRAKFITGAAFATTNFVVACAEGDKMEGSMIVAGAVVDVDAADQINFVATAENIGDFVEVFSDGTYWHVFGNALTTGGLTATG